MINLFKRYLDPLTQEGSGESESLLRFKKDYEDSNDFVRKLICWHLRNEQVDDLVQETYLKAWKSYSSFNRESHFSTWIYRIAMNIIADHYRKSKSIISSEEEIAIEEKRDEKDLITFALNALDANEKELFILFYKFGYTFKEIAAISQKSENSIKTIVYRAKDKFVKVYQKHNGVSHE